MILYPPSAYDVTREYFRELKEYSKYDKEVSYPRYRLLAAAAQLREHAGKGQDDETMRAIQRAVTVLYMVSEWYEREPAGSPIRQAIADIYAKHEQVIEESKQFWMGEKFGDDAL